MQMPVGQAIASPAPTSDNNDEIRVTKSGYKRARIPASSVIEGPSESETHGSLADGKWEVKRVIDSRWTMQNRRRLLQYRIQWRGDYPLTWELQRPRPVYLRVAVVVVRPN